MSRTSESVAHDATVPTERTATPVISAARARRPRVFDARPSFGALAAPTRSGLTILEVHHLNLNTVQVKERAISIPLIERHSLAAWPGLAQSRIGGWVLTFGDGHTKRANSACLPQPDLGDPIKDIDAVIDAYARVGAPPLFRITQITTNDGVQQDLKQRGYGQFDETLVQIADLSRDDAPPPADVTTRRAAAPGWRRELALAQGLGEASARAQDRFLDRIQGDAIYAAAMDRGVPVAWGMGVVADGILGLFNIVTTASHRGRGHGGRLVRALLAEGRTLGAQTAYLQVGVANPAARGLYARLGFHDHYRYVYWGAR